MVWRLIDKLSERRRNEILLEVRERNTVAQVFFRSFGFRAISVIRSHYEDTDEDAYLMQFLLEKTMDDSPFELKNRIASYYE